MSVWIAGATLVVGAAGVAASVSGSKKQAKANQAAIDANSASNSNTNAANLQANQNNIAANFRNYLLTRGVGDNGQVVNTRLPLWASVNRPSATPQLGWRKKGSGTPAGALMVRNPTFTDPNAVPATPPPDDPAVVVAATDPKKPSFKDNFLTSQGNIFAPGLGTVLSGKPVTIKNVVKDAFDPFGWF